MPLTSLEILSFPGDTCFRARALLWDGGSEHFDLCRDHALELVLGNFNRPKFVVANARSTPQRCAACISSGGVMGLVKRYRIEHQTRDLMKQYSNFKGLWK